jgi:hypothetical protein
MTMSTLEKLEQLVVTFRRDIQFARELESANPEDDLAIKAAVVGFSYNAPTESWAEGHFDFVKARLDKDYHDRELAEYGENSENVRLFFALSLGYLLGLCQQEEIHDEEFKVTEHQIPGLIMLHLGELTAEPA